MVIGHDHVAWVGVALCANWMAHRCPQSLKTAFEQDPTLAIFGLKTGATLVVMLSMNSTFEASDFTR